MRFEKVSCAQYLKDSMHDTFYTTQQESYTIADHANNFANNFNSLKGDLPLTVLERAYEDIKIPCRATKSSAGYDFFSPYDIYLGPGESIKLSTGIRVLLDPDKFLLCAPRSSHGFKSRIQLDNTVGIIDADYAQSENEGHIMVKLTNDSTCNRISIKKGEGLIQAIISQYFTVDDDNVTTTRNGGFGSTNN